MKIKNLFVKESPEAQQGSGKQTKTPQQPAVITSIYQQHADSQQPAVQDPNLDYSGHVIELLKQLNRPGPDYFEFRAALDNVAGQPLSDQQKYQMIFAGFSSMGVTSQKLIDTANFYIGKLGEEQTAFAQELDGARKAQISDKQVARDKLAADNIELGKKMQDNQNAMTQLDNEMNSSTLSLSAKEASFNQAVSFEAKTITTHITNIKLYLNGTITK